MLMLCRVLKPLAWLFSSITEGLIRVLGLPAKRDETISYRDILALTEAGYQAGVVADEEQQVIANVFELDTRTVETVMTERERIVFFSRDDDDVLIRNRIADDAAFDLPRLRQRHRPGRRLCRRDRPVPARAAR